jgi:alpha-tubulin suppressor-like RCC1 family protein
MRKKLFQGLLSLIVFALPLLLPAIVYAAIPQVAAGQSHTVGLKSVGTVVAVGWNEYGQCDIESWTDIR